MSPDTIKLLIYAIPALLVAISLHEMMHALVAYWLGDDLARSRGRISFNPLRHIDPLTTVALPLILVLAGLPPFAAAKPVPINTARLKWDEFGMAAVGVAGPLTNLLLALISAAILRITDITAFRALADLQVLAEPSLLSGFLIFSVLINIGLFVFNMIPFPPLDGSRLLYALVPESVQKIMLNIESTGFMAIAIFMLVGFPIIAPIIGAAQTLLLRLLL